jgi:phosphatidate phosphatase PAH1
MPKKNKQTTRKKSVAKKMTPKRKVARKRAVSKQSSLAKKKKFSAKRKRVTSTGLVMETVPLQSGEPRKWQDGQSGDLQGISDHPTANSESVEELLEEGNALEAEAVQGVESSLDADQGDVQTHEVPEDDVPQEYLDKDQ